MGYGGRPLRRSESATSKAFKGASSTQNESPSVRIPSIAITCTAPFPYLAMNWNQQRWNFLARFFTSQ
ncbi:hypothetical protein Goari_016314, partial [Gossypium aridum]|nr:hypothetical protein [Gossypium aridum]